MSTRKSRLGPPPGALASWVSDALPIDEQEAFWKCVLDFENAPLVSDFQRLIDAGLALPDPDTLEEQELKAKLWEVIHALAEMDVFLHSTDHLSDRELYALLWSNLLRVEEPDMPGVTTHVDILGGCSEHDTHLYLKYYADDQCRQGWREDFPG
jgi:hypothetical protein